jgi:hypothetical protein
LLWDVAGANPPTVYQKPSYLENQSFHRCPSLLGCRAKEVREKVAFAVPVEVACTQ